MSRVVVIGGGLVGCVVAHSLKRRGLDVVVYERHEDPKSGGRPARPSVNLTLCERGLRPLRRAGLYDVIESGLMPAFRRVVHCEDGTLIRQPYGDADQSLACVARNDLNARLLTAVVARGVTVEFGARCTDVAPDGRAALISTAACERWVEADCIIAADGSGSAVREALMRQGGCRATREFADQGYVELRVPAAATGRPLLEIDALHLWPRRAFMAIAFPNPDGSFTCAVHLPLEGDVSFAAVKDAPAASSLFERSFPELAALVPDVAARFVSQQPNTMSTVRCAPWTAGGRVLLIGDAAHGILPYYGQGANAGFEDCALLDDLVDAHGSAWPEVFSLFLLSFPLNCFL